MTHDNNIWSFEQRPNFLGHLHQATGYVGAKLGWEYRHLRSRVENIELMADSFDRSPDDVAATELRVWWKVEPTPTEMRAWCEAWAFCCYAPENVRHVLPDGRRLRLQPNGRFDV